MRREETSPILSQGLYYREGGFLPDRVERLSTFSFERSLAGVTSDLHLYPLLLASSLMGGAAPSTGLEPGHH